MCDGVRVAGKNGIGRKAKDKEQDVKYKRLGGNVDVGMGNVASGP